MELDLQKYETTEINLMTQEGRLIYASKAYRFFEDVSERNFFKQITGEKGYFVDSQGGRDKLFSYVHSEGYGDFNGLGWILVVSHSTQEVLRSAISLRNSLIAASLILLVATLLIFFSLPVPYPFPSGSSRELLKASLLKISILKSIQEWSGQMTRSGSWHGLLRIWPRA